MSKLFKWFNKDNKSQTNTEAPPLIEKTSDAHSETEKSAEPKHSHSGFVEETVQSENVEEIDGKTNTESKSEEPAVTTSADSAPAESTKDGIPSENDARQKASFFGRLKASLSKTKSSIGSGFVSLFKGKAIDDELYEDLETQLLIADVGMDTTQKIIQHLTDSMKRSQLKDGDALFTELKQQMADMLLPVNEPLWPKIAAHDPADGPFVILMVGVNGVGKTTTIGKLAKQFQNKGKKVMLAAGDTFRAAAVEQLQVWGERNNIPVIAQHTGADSASVLYDAVEAAKARNVDILLADTAGRLQNKDNLMEELKKVVRVMKKVHPNAPHEVMLTLDAGTGQNALSQASLFDKAVGLTGLTLTKLDGTAKGGVIFALADKMQVPIRYLGVGEGIDDLQSFDSEAFIQALFSDNTQEES